MSESGEGVIQCSTELTTSEARYILDTVALNLLFISLSPPTSGRARG
jgi:hypothetical protein